MLGRCAATLRSLRTRRSATVALLLTAILFAACGSPPWVRVQNVGSTTANVNITYYDEAGQAVARDSRQLAPGEAAEFPIKSNDRLPSGYRGSSIVESDQPVIALRST